MKIKRIYRHYHEWEDYQNGMYKTSIPNESDLIQKAKQILSSPHLFREIARQVLYTWKVATAVNLTNNTCNKKAWVGQASCCYQYGIPETVTRIAWGQLTEQERTKANEVAQSLIDNWTYNHTYGRTQLSFDF